MPNAFNFSASPFDCLTPDQQRLVRASVDVAYYPQGETNNLNTYDGSGGIVVGAKVPLVLLSRAESAETKIQSIAIALLVRKHQLG